MHPSSKQDGSVFNVVLFGGTFRETQPEEGVSHIKIKAEEVENIIGYAEHWNFEMKQRQEAILKAGSQNTFMKKAFHILNKSTFPAEVTGEDLVGYYPSKSVLKLHQELKQEPDNPNTRIQMVWKVVKSNQSFPIETYRALLLQAAIACTLGKLKLADLHKVLYLQGIYYNRLFKFSRERLAKIQSQLEAEVESNEKDEEQEKQHQSLLKQSERIRRNMSILNQMLQDTNRRLRNISHLDIVVSYKEIKALTNKLIESQKDDEKKEDILKAISTLIPILCAIPLLHTETLEFTDLLINFSPEESLVYFFKGRVLMSTLQLRVSQYENGYKNKSVQQQIKEIYKGAFQAYEQAILRIPKANKNDRHFTMLLEYVQLIHYFYSACKYTLGIEPATPWMQSNFNKAMQALKLAEESGKTEMLKLQITKVMEEEKLMI